METLKDKAGAFCARHSRRLAALQFAVLILVIAVAGAACGWAMTRMMYVEYIGEIKLQNAAEMERLQAIYRERLGEKDQVIDRKDEQISGEISALVGRIDRLAGKTEQAASTANSAASKANTAAEKATQAVKQTAPRTLPPQKAPDWLGGP